MGRIVCIDYGRKRTGFAATDENRMIATGLTTVPTHLAIDFLRSYLQQEVVDVIVVGKPMQMNNTDSESEQLIVPFVKNIEKLYPEIKVERVDERFTSKMAARTLIDSGTKKKDRRNKLLIDTISATIILQTYLEMLQNNTAR